MRVAEYVVHALLRTNYFERQSHSHSLGVPRQIRPSW